MLRILAAILLTAGVAIAQPDPGEAPAPASQREFSTADGLLEALEDADRDILTLRADLVYEKIMVLQSDRHIRFGTLYFRVDGDPDVERPARTFAVHFDRLWLDGAIRDDRQAWIFDGHWLVEKRFAEKQYVAREITKPGDTVDPLRLGEGPLPIPIGQRKADILARFDASLPPTGEGLDPVAHDNYLDAVRGATQLHLTPRTDRASADAAGGEGGRFESIRIWYRRNAEGALLPLLAHTVDHKGDEAFVLLTKTRLNERIPDDATDTQPPPPGEGWDVQHEEWRAATDP